MNILSLFSIVNSRKEVPNENSYSFKKQNSMVINMAEEDDYPNDNNSDFVNNIQDSKLGFEVNHAASLLKHNAAQSHIIKSKENKKSSSEDKTSSVIKADTGSNPKSDENSGDKNNHPSNSLVS